MINQRTETQRTKLRVKTLWEGSQSEGKANSDDRGILRRRRVRVKVTKKCYRAAGSSQEAAGPGILEWNTYQSIQTTLGVVKRPTLSNGRCYLVNKIFDINTHRYPSHTIYSEVFIDLHYLQIWMYHFLTKCSLRSIVPQGMRKTWTRVQLHAEDEDEDNEEVTMQDIRTRGLHFPISLLLAQNQWSQTVKLKIRSWWWYREWK